VDDHRGQAADRAGVSGELHPREPGPRPAARRRRPGFPGATAGCEVPAPGICGWDPESGCDSPQRLLASGSNHC